MEKEQIAKRNGVVFISESCYNNTGKDFKGVWNIERWDCDDWEEERDKYMCKRTWMPPFSLFNTSCLLVEGRDLEILPDQEWERRFGGNIKSEPITKTL